MESDSLRPPSAVEGLRMLFVDDSADERELFEIRFGLHGVVVRTAHTAARALAMLEAEQFDLLVCDLRIPVCDGFELIRRVRRLPSECSRIPAVAVSGLARPEDARQARAAGFDGLLAKPYVEEDLIALVSTLDRVRGASPGASAPDVAADEGASERAPDPKSNDHRCGRILLAVFGGRGLETAFG
jgi:two-component system CheB/CheR fusion protein